MKKIVVSVATDGSTKIEAFGFSGAACLKATKDIEEALGKIASRKQKPEMGSVKNDPLITQG